MNVFEDWSNVLIIYCVNDLAGCRVLNILYSFDILAGRP